MDLKNFFDLKKEEILEKTKDIFLFPYDLNVFREYSDKKIKLASLDEVLIIIDHEFIKENEELVDKGLKLKDIAKLYCLSQGYAGLVKVERSFMPITRRVNLKIKAVVDNFDELANKMNDVVIPIYQTEYCPTCRGLPVTEVK